MLEPIDLIERHPDSRVWQPYLSDQDVIIVSRDNPATKWVRYAGFLGAPLGTPKFTQATEVWGAPLGVMAKLYTDIIARMAEVLKLTKQSDPTRGLGARHYIQHQHVSSWKHVQALSTPNLVCQHICICYRLRVLAINARALLLQNCQGYCFLSYCYSKYFQNHSPG